VLTFHCPINLKCAHKHKDQYNKTDVIKLINNGRGKKQIWEEKKRKSISSIDNVLKDGNVHQGRPFTDIVIENQ
jgi:hypothetical protein